MLREFLQSGLSHGSVLQTNPIGLGGGPMVFRKVTAPDPDLEWLKIMGNFTNRCYISVSTSRRHKQSELGCKYSLYVSHTNPTGRRSETTSTTLLASPKPIPNSLFSGLSSSLLAFGLEFSPVRSEDRYCQRSQICVPFWSQTRGYLLFKRNHAYLDLEDTIEDH